MAGLGDLCEQKEREHTTELAEVVNVFEAAARVRDADVEKLTTELAGLGFLCEEKERDHKKELAEAANVFDREAEARAQEKLTAEVAEAAAHRRDYECSSELSQLRDEVSR